MDVSAACPKVIDVILEECERIELTGTVKPCPLLLLGSAGSEESGEIARVLELEAGAGAGAGTGEEEGEAGGEGGEAGEGVGGGGGGEEGIEVRVRVGVDDGVFVFFEESTVAIGAD